MAGPAMRRRVFISSLTLLVSVCFVCAAAHGEDTNTPSTVSAKSRVVLVRDPSVVNSFTVDAAKARTMVATGIKTFTGEHDEATAWRHFVSTQDVVVIKIDMQSGPLQS